MDERCACFEARAFALVPQREGSGAIRDLLILRRSRAWAREPRRTLGQNAADYLAFDCGPLPTSAWQAAGMAAIDIGRPGLPGFGFSTLSVNQ